MTAFVTPQGLSLPPTSRQDIISALLNDYGNSFEGETSPVPGFDELPPPPPPKSARDLKYSDDKPLPAIEKMNMPFQLRNDPVSPDALNGPSSAEGSPTRIVSKRLKRRSVPRSLTLTKSNGSTAVLPSPPTISSQLEAHIPSKEQAEEQKSLPPPPPEKSARRQQQAAMGNSNPKVRSPRKDSLHSQDGKDGAMEPVKRKPLPKFTSLAELGKGPRGGKGGPLPQPRPRKQSLEVKSDDDRGRTLVRSDVHSTNHGSTPSNPREQAAPMEAPRIVNPLPTPDDDITAAAPQPTRLPFGGMGLPSNPKHKKGKSSTGFDILKSATSPQTQQPPQLPEPDTITPGPTPSPNRMTKMQHDEIVETVDPPRNRPADSSVSNTPRRPFSFEPPVSTSPPPKESSISTDEGQNTTADTTTPRSTSAVSPVKTKLPTTQPVSFPPRSAPRAPPPSAFTSLPSQQRLGIPEAMESAPESPTTPPFVPLTDAPVPRSTAPITEKHLHCYSRHATFVWSRNDYQPMACMICNKNDQERRWSCVWCYLRICVDCSVELQKTPGRDLQSMLRKRGAEATYGGAEYDEDENDSEESLHPGFDASVNANVNGKRHDSGNPALVVWDADAEDAGNRVDFS
ncbi:hypothetical protein BU23DRAFT_51544 [Bimuria novae-zelandiae CBS 107.79]|uniref:Uncharacterized protein n=1 Tax=Bimuria novae-zelandiae CBS 107.79 TaxID=1447943 RepID=A0A6A5UJ79_9PLEO|nr:hypothetical protein BU23DRAFT_51544 [Bimuria novae-zelandiae CBS 107.79]